MSERLTAADWVAARGDKWAAQLSGMEATLGVVDTPLIQALRLDAPYRIADIGCGGGGTTLAIRQQAPAGSVVHGFDIAPGLVDLARQRITADDQAIAFHVADMASTPAPETAYDRLVSRFGVMFFDEPQAAFANLSHWLVPGGRFAFAVWGRIADNPWMTTVRDVAAEVIALQPAQPDAPGPFRYGEAATLLDLLDRAGFADLAVDDWRGSLPIGGGLPAAEAAAFAIKALGTFGEQLAKAGDGALDRARQLLTARYAEHERDGAVRMEACVHLVTGTRR